MRYLVYDIALVPPPANPGKRRVVPLESSAVSHRYVVSACGVIRAYQLTKGEARKMNPVCLVQQLSGAEYAATTPLQVEKTRPT
jgi:hypothetical protein